MLFALAMQVAAIEPQAPRPEDCLPPLTREEQARDDASRSSIRKAGKLIVLEPDDDQLPPGAPADFKPQLVTISYLIGSDGRVSDCLVDKPATIAIFNVASCELLGRHYPVGAGPQSSKRQKAAVNWTPRALRPQRRLCNNNYGTVPVSSNRWITSQVFSGAPMQAGSALMALTIGANGQVQNCTIRAADIDKALQRNLCAMASQRAVVLPAVDGQGNGVPSALSFVVRFRLPT